MPGYVPRLVDSLLAEYLTELSAIMLVGPRACGKTTTAALHANTIIQLDSEVAGAAFRYDPDAALRNRVEPVLLDEWQVVPSVMGAVKRAVDAERRPGRFLITGSARRQTDDQLWPGTGRVVMMPMYPMTVAERLQRPIRPFVDRITAGELLNRAEGQVLDIQDYLQLALRGGFPEPALELSESTVRGWLESYADQVALRDARAFGEIPDAGRLRRYLEAYALNSAGTPHDKTLYDSAGITRATALAYERRLGELMVVDQLPAWSTNRLKRLARTPKRYIIDSGLLGGILGIGIDDLLTDGRLMGSMVETFVVAQLRAEAAVARARYRLSHLREANGRHEIDVIVEFGGGRLVCIEVKASASVTPRDARHLLWLQEAMQDRFIAGVVLHTGNDTYKLAKNITAAPISTLWS